MRTVTQSMSMMVAVLMGMLAGLGVAHAQPAPASRGDAAAPYAVEYDYTVKWGHFDEFMELYKRNHYPILLGLIFILIVYLLPNGLVGAVAQLRRRA